MLSFPFVLSLMRLMLSRLNSSILLGSAESAIITLLEKPSAVITSAISLFVLPVAPHSLNI